MRVARQSRFHRILGEGMHAGGAQEQAMGSSSQGTAEPALPGRQCRPLGGDAVGGAGGDSYCSVSLSPGSEGSGITSMPSSISSIATSGLVRPRMLRCATSPWCMARA